MPASVRLDFRVSSQAFRSRCAPARSHRHTLYPDRGAAQPSPPAPPYVCRVQPSKHPCIAPGTHLAQAVPVPRPPPSTRIPIGHPAHPHESRGRCIRFRSGLATPGLREDLLWRDLYVCVSVVSRCHMHEFGCCRASSRAAVCCGAQPCVAGAWVMIIMVCVIVQSIYG